MTLKEYKKAIKKYTVDDIIAKATSLGMVYQIEEMTEREFMKHTKILVDEISRRLK